MPPRRRPRQLLLAACALVSVALLVVVLRNAPAGEELRDSVRSAVERFAKMRRSPEEHAEREDAGEGDFDGDWGAEYGGGAYDGGAGAPPGDGATPGGVGAPPGDGATPGGGGNDDDRIFDDYQMYPMFNDMFWPLFLNNSKFNDKDVRVGRRELSSRGGE